MNTVKADLLAFLRSQECIAIATSAPEPWIANVYYGVGDDLRFYFVSGTDPLHSRQIEGNPHISFATFWFDTKNHANRKGFQGKGICKIADDPIDIETGVRLHNTRFPEFSKRITLDYIKSNDNTRKIWIITPTLVKFWNDELYGTDGWRELQLEVVT